VIGLKTTILIDDEIYKRVVEEAIRTYGSAKNISAVVNRELRMAFSRKKEKAKKSYLGAFKLKNFDLSDLREKKDRAV